MNITSIDYLTIFWYNYNGDKMKNKIISILKCLALFTLFFTISTIPIVIFKIDIEAFSNFEFLLYSFSCNIAFLIVITVCYFKTLKKDFNPFFKDFANNFEEAFKYYIIGLGIMIASNLIITYVLGGGVGSNEETVRSYIDIAPILMFLEVAIYAPLAEELLFRKSIRELVSNKWLYIFISGFIFGALHVVSGITSAFDLLYLIPYCSLGFTFAYMYAKTNNIYSTITIHSVHNAITMILYFVGANLW